jgi:outer membrane protein OmpA-like peptidoglycan-associated protein
MRSSIAPILAALALAIVIYAATRLYPPAIEADLIGRTSAALSEAGYGFADVSANGRDVRLTGTAPTELARAQATRKASAVRGVRRLENRLSVAGFISAPTGSSDARESVAQASGSPGSDLAEPERSGPAPAEPDTGPAPWNSRFSLRGDELTLTGDAPDVAFRERVAQTVPERFGDIAVRDSLSVRDGAADGTDTVLQAALAELAAFEEGDVVLRDGRLEISGTLRPGSDPSAVKQRVESALADGFVLDFQATAAAPAAVAEECQSALSELLAGRSVQFAFGSADLDTASHALLDDIAEAAGRCPDAALEVAGHTDSAGDAEFNQRLSLARARSVVAYLTARGVAASRLEAVGYGESQPRADNTTAQGRRENRRIEIVVQEQEP